MRKYLLHACFLLLPFSLLAQGGNDLDKEGFHQLILQSFDDVFSAGKIDRINAYYADGFLILEDGVIWNRDSVVHALSQMKDRPNFTRKNTIDVRQFERKGATAWGSYFNDAHITLASGRVIHVRWLESAVLIKVKKEWKISVLHSTVVHRK